jgi:hypothetical protein
MKNKILISIVLLLISVSTVLADDYTKMAEDFKKSLPDTMEFVCTSVNDSCRYVLYVNKCNSFLRDKLFIYDIETQKEESIELIKELSPDVYRDGVNIYKGKEHLIICEVDLSLEDDDIKVSYLLCYNFQKQKLEIQESWSDIIIDEKEKKVMCFVDDKLKIYDYDGNILIEEKCNSYDYDDRERMENTQQQMKMEIVIRNIDPNFHWLERMNYNKWLHWKETSYPVKDSYGYLEDKPQYKFRHDTYRLRRFIVYDASNKIVAVTRSYGYVGDYDFYYDRHHEYDADKIFDTLIKYDFDHNAYNIKSDNKNVQNCVERIIRKGAKRFHGELERRYWQNQFSVAVVERAFNYIEQLKKDNYVGDIESIQRIDGMNFLLCFSSGVKVKQTFYKYNDKGKESVGVKYIIIKK